MDIRQAQTFMEIAKDEAKNSNDNRTKVGAVIVNSKSEIIGKGYNCMPMGRDSDFPWLTRRKAIFNTKYGIQEDHKHLYVCHAELNAIVNAYKSGANLQGSTIYVTLNPCNECAKLIAQTGIREILFIEKRTTDEFNAARRILDTVGVKYTQVE